MKHLKRFDNINEDHHYENMNGIVVIDDKDNKVIGFIVEPVDIEKKLYDIVLNFSDDVELNDLPSNLEPFSGDILINGNDLHHNTKITLRLQSAPMY